MKMRKLNFKNRVLVTILLVIFGSSTLFATDGYFSLGYDTKSKGMAGAGVALWQNSFFGVSNPASMVMHGKKYGVSLGLFNPNRSYEIEGAPSMYPGTMGLAQGKVESGSKYFPIPALVANWMSSTEKSSFGVSIYGNGGMNTDYKAPTFGSEPTGVNLIQVFGAMTYSQKLSEKWRLGISAIIAYQSFKARGIAAFAMMSQAPQYLSEMGDDQTFGFGGKIGIQGELADGLYFGVTYQTEMFMQKFDNYKGLFAEDGGFDIPSSWTVGFAYELTDRITAVFDLKQIYYNKIKSIANPMSQAPLGSEAGSGFGWRKMTIFKFGLEHACSDAFKVRAGFSHGKNPIRPTDVLFNILAPGVIEDHITFGISKMLGEKEISVALIHALSNTVSGINPMDPPADQIIHLNMNQWELEFALTF